MVTKQKILIVDDDNNIAELISLYLVKECFETKICNDGETAISTFDSSESFYHGFFLSLLYEMTDYVPRSNREEGIGRPDIVLYPENPEDPAYIFEIKTRKKFNEMRDGVQEALRQIKDQQYEEGILEDGYAGVISFGVCFCKKSCILELMGDIS